MAALLYKLARPRCSSRQWLRAILRDHHDRATRMTLRDGAGLPTRGGRPATPYSPANSRRQHTEAAAPVEVDLKRLEGEDDGRNTHTRQFVIHTDACTFDLKPYTC